VNTRGRLENRKKRRKKKKKKKKSSYSASSAFGLTGLGSTNPWLVGGGIEYTSGGKSLGTGGDCRGAEKLAPGGGWYVANSEFTKVPSPSTFDSVSQTTDSRPKPWSVRRRNSSS